MILVVKEGDLNLKYKINSTLIVVSLVIVLITFGIVGSIDGTLAKNFEQSIFKNLFSSGENFLTGAAIGVEPSETIPEDGQDNPEMTEEPEIIIAEDSDENQDNSGGLGLGGDLGIQANCGWGVGPCSCGDTATADVYMGADFACTGDGLVIGANHLIVNCSGYNIIGDGGGPDVGIKNDGGWKNITIENCIIKSFGKGIEFMHAPNATIWNNTIGHVNLSEPNWGISFANCSDANISNNIITNLTSDNIDSVFGIQYAEAPGSALFNVVISGNNISKIYGADNILPFGMSIGDKGILDLNNVKIDNNIIENINCTSAGGGTSCMIVGGVGLKVNSGTNVNITNNNISYIGAGMILDQPSLRLVGNYLIGNTYGIGTMYQGASTRFNHSWLENNTFQDLTYGFVIAKEIYNNTLLNNNFSGSLQYSILDESAHNNTMIYNNSMGEIKWENINLTNNITLDINASTLFLENNTIGLANNTNARILGLNGTAKIKFTNLGYNSVPYLLKNGTRCDNTDNCNISYDASTGILLANVTSFSNYTTQASLLCGDSLYTSTNLTDNLSGCTGNGLVIGANDVVLDCNGYTIIGDGDVFDMGIKNTDVYSNTTVKNCFIKNFGTGISFSNSFNSTIWNNTVGHVSVSGDSAGGINFVNCTQANISNNIITNISGDNAANPFGLTFAESAGYNLFGSVIQNNNISFIYGADNLNPLGMNLGDGVVNGIDILSVINNTITNLSCTSAGGGTACEIVGSVGLKIHSGNYTNITDNTIGYCDVGMILDQPGLRLTRNLFFNNSNYAVSTFFQGAPTRLNHSWFENNTFVNSTIAFHLAIGASNNTFYNNNFTGNVQYGLLDESGQDNNIMIYNNSMGEIKWSVVNLTNNVDLNINGSATLYLENNTIGLANNTNAKILGLNGSAQIKFYSFSYNVTPILLKNGTRCDNNSNCNISYDATTGILLANISGFSNYTTQADAFPNVTLLLPAENLINSSSNPYSVTFSCNSSDDYQLVNVSLYLTNASNVSFTKNRSANISTPYNQTNWTINMAPGNYTWNCLAYDNNNKRNFSTTNRTILLNFSAADTTAPTFTSINNQSVSHTAAFAAQLTATDDVAIGNWTINDTTNFAMNDSGYLTNATNLSIDVYLINVTINDTSGNNASAVMFVNVTNALPNVSVPILTPASVYENTTLIATVNYTDGDNDFATIYFVWYVNGTEVLTQTNTSINNSRQINSSINGTNFSKNAVVNVTVYPDDGYNTTSVVYNTTTILNTPPNLTTFTINTTSPVSNSTLEINTTFTDIDADSGTITIIWYANGSAIYNQTNVSVSNGTQTTALLLGANLSKNQQINVSVNATDGVDVATTGWSTNLVTVLNSQPVFNGTISNQSVQYGTEFTFQANCTDVDGSVDTILYYSNTSLFNISVSGNGTINDTPTFAELGNYSVNITCGDGLVNNSQTIVYSVVDTVSPVLLFTGPLGPTNETTDLLNVTTDENATCQYKNSTGNYTNMGTTGNVNHSQNATALAAGSNLFTVQCNDSSSNAVTKTKYIVRTALTANASALNATNVTGNTSVKVSPLKKVNVTLNVSKNIGNAFVSVSEFSANPEATAFAISGNTVTELIFYAIDVPAVESFINKITLQFVYNETEVTNAGITEANLKVYFFNSSSDTWVEESEQLIDTTLNHITVNVTHLSTFILGQATASSSSTSSTSSSSSSSTSSGSGNNAWGVCGDGLCNGDETCTNDKSNNMDSGECYLDCGICAVPESAWASKIEGEAPAEELSVPGEDISNEEEASEKSFGENVWNESRNIIKNLSSVLIALLILIAIGGLFAYSHHRNLLSKENLAPQREKHKRSKMESFFRRNKKNISLILKIAIILLVLFSVAYLIYFYFSNIVIFFSNLFYSLSHSELINNSKGIVIAILILVIISSLFIRTHHQNLMKRGVTTQTKKHKPFLSSKLNKLGEFLRKHRKNISMVSRIIVISLILLSAAYLIYFYFSNIVLFFGGLGTFFSNLIFSLVNMGIWWLPVTILVLFVVGLIYIYLHIHKKK
jgi:hypothetical protein